MSVGDPFRTEVQECTVTLANSAKVNENGV